MSGHARACTSTPTCILPATPDDVIDGVIADVGMMTSSPTVGAGVSSARAHAPDPQPDRTMLPMFYFSLCFLARKKCGQIEIFFRRVGGPKND
jgi:hypothetical protein